MNPLRKTVASLLASIIAFGAVALAGCTTNESIALDMADARVAIDRGDIVNAQSICDNLYSNHFDRLSARQLASLSLMFMELSNINDNYSQADNVAAATRCYISAFEANADSARSFCDSIQGGYDAGRLTALHQIVKSITTAPDIADTDSVPTDTQLVMPIATDSIPTE